MSWLNTSPDKDFYEDEIIDSELDSKDFSVIETQPGKHNLPKTNRGSQS